MLTLKSVPCSSSSGNMAEFRLRTGSIWIYLLLVTFFMGIQTFASAQRSSGYYKDSNAKLKELAKQDFKTVAQLFSKISQKELEPSVSVLKIVNEYLEDFANCTKIGATVTQHVQEVIRNPLSRFKLLARIVRFFKLLKDEAIDDIPGLAVNKLKDELKKTGPPLKTDLFAAIDAIFCIHFTYDLNATDLAAGRIKGVDTGLKLLASNCFLIGLRAKIRGKYTLAVDWLGEALHLAAVDGTVDKNVVQMAIMNLFQDHNWEWEHQELTNFNLFMKPLMFIKSKETRVRVKDVLYKEYGGRGRNCSYWPMNTWGLCSGQNFHTPSAGAHLFCWIEFKMNNILTIGPLKMEFLSRDPDIVQIHRAFTQDFYGKFEALPASLRRRTNKIVASIGGRRNARNWTTDRVDVVHYLAGSRKINNERPANGSQTKHTATLMVFLNTVEEGGATVFPAAFTSAMPAKGSAIFWFNTLSDGTPDILTEHSECPVALGEKLIAYRHFQFSDGFSGQKCQPEPKERLKVLVNGKALPVPIPFKHKPADEECNEPKHLFAATGPPGEFQKFGRGNRIINRYAFTPISSLKPLVRLDWEIYQKVKKIWHAYAATGSSHGDSDEPEGIDMVKRYLQDFNETAYNSVSARTNVTDMEQVYRLAWNPLAAYRTVWRFEYYVRKWMTEQPQEHTGGQLGRTIRDYIGSVYDMQDGPSTRDLEDAVAGILNIQLIHDLRSSHIASGIVVGTDVGIVLSARQCIEIGTQAIVSGFYYQAMDWLNTAIQKIVSEGDRTGDVEEAEEELQVAKMAHDKYLATSSDNAADLELNSFGAESESFLPFPSNSTHVQFLYNNFMLVNNEGEGDVNFLRNCQGETHQTVQERSKLFCWQEARMHPYLRIAPVKAEILSMHPRSEVVLYHDLIGEGLLAYLCNDTGRSYNFSTTTFDGGTNSRTRLSAMSFIYADNSDDSLRLFQTVRRVTGLDVMRRSIAIGSYTAGGHLLFHTDTDGFDFHGNVTSIASFMFYVTAAKQGGATSFSQADVLIDPVAGSAVFWYSTLSSGNRDGGAYHGSCPIIFGEKQIATHFINYVDQDQLQCQLDPTSRIEILVNGKSKYGDQSASRRSRPLPF